MNPYDIEELVVGPVLKELDLYSPEAVRLVMGTGFVESGFREIRQQGGGPALGFWQMEPATHDDIWENYLKYRSDVLVSKLETAADISFEPPPPHYLAWNMRYAAAMCRIHYLRVPEPIPTDLEGQAAYWKKWYNTPLGKGTVEKYLAAVGAV